MLQSRTKQKYAAERLTVQSVQGTDAEPFVANTPTRGRGEINRPRCEPPRCVPALTCTCVSTRRFMHRAEVRVRRFNECYYDPVRLGSCTCAGVREYLDVYGFSRKCGTRGLLLYRLGAFNYYHIIQMTTCVLHR